MENESEREREREKERRERERKKERKVIGKIVRRRVEKVKQRQQNNHSEEIIDRTFFLSFVAQISIFYI